MRKYSFFVVMFMVVFVMSLAVGTDFEEDIFKTSKGDLKITFIGHGTLMFTFGGKVIHVDPVGRYADYSKLPKADIILVTHEHVQELKIEAVPAYNIVHMRSGSSPFHPKGHGNGYVITFANKRVYVAGDTENTPEMKKLKNIDIAFLPMNLPYTMDPEMVADAAKVFMPKILYPYHFGRTDTSKLVALLKDKKGIEVRIRKLN